MEENDILESNDGETPQTMTRLCSIEIIGQNIQIQQTRADDSQSARVKNLEKECQRRPLLDGRYFQLDLEKTEEKKDGKIEVVCKMCPGKKHISGDIAISSNFITHIKVCNYVFLLIIY